jgi:hypothetical protein
MHNTSAPRNPTFTQAEAIAWRTAALKDGWSMEPLHEHASWEAAARLERQGFVAYVYATPKDPAVFVWGSDKLGLHSTVEYSWDALVRGLRICLECGAEDVPTQRVWFAGRVCETCLPAARVKYETKGWAD